MYPGANARADQPAVIMAGSGVVITYGMLEAQSNQLAHLLRAQGLKRLDHISIFMENTPQYIACCLAAERTGLYYTCINSFLTADEAGYILGNSESKLLITSQAKREVALAAMAQCPAVTLCLVVDGPGDGGRVRNLEAAIAAYPATPVADETLGTAMLYSSGTTGRPKGVLRPLPDQKPGDPLAMFSSIAGLWRFRPGMTYLSPAPLYHAAPHLGVNLTLRQGGTVVVMERFDPEAFLRLVEQYRVTHTQLVPTMFSRMLKLTDDVRARHNLASLEIAIHAAAPCPPQVKAAMIEWWGPIIFEYYGMTEGMGFTACTTAEWLAHRGTVGRVLMGELHILDAEMNELPPGEVGTVWFRLASDFEYFNDRARTAAALSPDGTMGTAGDVGYVDADGFLFLTDRASFMIISGGVNIYPQECEDLLISHPWVQDAAVFGVPNADLGEEVKAVVQLVEGVAEGAAVADALIEYCGRHLARQKVPRSVDFLAELPRLPTGKLYKQVLRDRYWAGHATRIV